MCFKNIDFEKKLLQTRCVYWQIYLLLTSVLYYPENTERNVISVSITLKANNCAWNRNQLLRIEEKLNLMARLSGALLFKQMGSQYPWTLTKALYIHKRWELQSTLSKCYLKMFSPSGYPDFRMGTAFITVHDADSLHERHKIFLSETSFFQALVNVILTLFYLRINFLNKYNCYIK